MDKSTNNTKSNKFNNIKGQIISGRFAEIIARQKSGSDFELGEILISEDETSKSFMQVYDIQYASQISQQNLELVSGLNLEEEGDFEFMDQNMRNYKLAFLKNLIVVQKNTNNVSTTKALPKIFSTLRSVEKSDIEFLKKPLCSMFFGYLRSGSSALDVPIYLNGEDVLTHHVLISGTTGKGKSVLMSNLLWECTGKDYCALLVLDPHDEYYGRNSANNRENSDKKIGMKDHGSNVIYYTSKNPPVGTRTLKINLKVLRPQHFGCLDFSEAQEQAMNSFYKEYGQKWIESMMIDKPLKIVFNEATINVLKRRMMHLLDLNFDGEQVFCNGIFDISAGENTVKNICDDLESAKTVIIDTSQFSGHVELLIGSLITSEIFYKYKNYKMQGSFKDKPVISIVLEEAPRVLGKEILEKGSNIFSTIAREGRKFKVGLIAITQLPSLIPREILANMNTKIILGTDMMQERQAIIDSASQDLSSDSRSIASLDKGECILSSNFAKFAIPLKIPYFDDVARKDLENRKIDSSKNSAELEKSNSEKISEKKKPTFEFSGIEIIE